MSTQQEQRAQTRSHRPDSAEFRKFIGEKWGPRQPNPYPPSPAIPFCVERRSRLGAQFQGQRLVIPAEMLKLARLAEPTSTFQREYRYRLRDNCGCGDRCASS